MQIVCVGDCGIDHYLPGGDIHVGGITANFARNARHVFPASDEIHVISPLGNDEAADLVRAAFMDSGIICHFSSVDGATPVQYIEIEPDGERRFVSYEVGVLRNFHLSADQQALIASSDLLVAPVFLQIVGLFDALIAIPTQGVVAVDFADFLQHPDFTLLETHIDHIDIGFFGLTLNDTEAIAAIAQLARARDKLFVVTLGPYGSHAYAGDRVFECAAEPVETIVDTTGAGDAFAAGFLANYCHDVGLPECLKAGARQAATVIRKFGAN